MWLDTKVNCERRLLNMAKQKTLFIEPAIKHGAAYQLKLGAGTFGTVIGVYEDLETAAAAYESICDALKRGDNYYKNFEDTEGAADIEQG